MVFGNKGQIIGLVGSVEGYFSDNMYRMFVISSVFQHDHWPLRLTGWAPQWKSSASCVNAELLAVNRIRELSVFYDPVGQIEVLLALCQVNKIFRLNIISPSDNIDMTAAFEYQIVRNNQQRLSHRKKFISIWAGNILQCNK